MHSKEFDYLLGVIHGDGNVGIYGHKESNGTSGLLQITVGKKDTEYVPVLCSLINKEFSYHAKVRCEKVFRIGIFPKWIVKLFLPYKEQGLWKFPEKPTHLEEYLGGLWDTDGCFSIFKSNGTIHRKIYLSQKHNGNLNQILPFLHELGFSPSFSTRKCRNALGEFKQDLISIPAKDFTLFTKISLRHPRKQREFQKILSYRKRWRNQFGSGFIE